ncbi:hypothetical protein [Candidatus Scalindua japonica]|uniref:hypothetical protein n=1 Tax=Candidatus Scalindua japonica TaxID=1284222 RepID=UPI0013A53B35|nr:hypothetical protein [Candidatus Scalindua japonica]
MRRTFKKKIIWKERETRKNLKKTKSFQPIESTETNLMVYGYTKISLKGYLYN